MNVDIDPRITRREGLQVGGSVTAAMLDQPVRLRFVLKNADLYSFQFVSRGEEP